jgi:hypothetical protein
MPGLDTYVGGARVGIHRLAHGRPALEMSPSAILDAADQQVLGRLLGLLVDPVRTANWRPLSYIVESPIRPFKMGEKTALSRENKVV